MNVSDINVFIDTNVLVYACDSTSGTKQAKALALIEHLKHSAKPCISTQVLQELYSILTSKFRIAAEDAKEVLLLYEKLHVVTVEVKDINDAVDFSKRWQISIWDALILTAAMKAGCSIVYTEDLNDGQTYGSIKVVNPFISR